MKKLQIIIFLFLALALGAPAQSGSAKKADRFYGSRCYALAIPHYLKARKKDSANSNVTANLADCYRFTNNTKGELRMYGELVQSGKASGLQKLYYAEALTEEGRFNEAQPYFEQYTNDARGKSKASAAEKIKSYSKNADAYKLSPASFNSAQSDFGSVTHNGSVYFLSSRYRSRWINYRHGWTNQGPVRVYKTARNDSLAEPVKTGGPAKSNEGSLCFVNDSVVYITMNDIETPHEKGREKKLKLYKAALSENKYSGLAVLPFCTGNFNFVHPAISADGNTLFFASDLDGGFGGMDVYMCSLAKDGTWSTPVNLGDKVNTAGNELFPFFSSKNLLYFSSNGHDGLGGLDIYETRIKENKAGRVYNMGLPINSKEDDFAFYLENDNKSGFISSNRQNGGLDDDIYNLTILRDVKRGKEVLLVARDKESGQLLTNVNFRTASDSVFTNEKGEFATVVDEDKSLLVRASHPDYFSYNDSVVASASNEDKITKVLMLEKDPKLALNVEVTDLKTKQPLPGVKVTIRELPGNEVLDAYTTPADGAHRKALPQKRIGDKLSYEFNLEKEGYLTKKALFIYDVKKPGDINVAENIDLGIGKVEVGMDVGKMIDIKPIYFDLGKSTIRKDAATELDKIVTIMKEYPNMSIELGSHTDCRSGAASNMKLSGARAKASAGYIVKKGIDKGRITGKGYGETKLLNNCGCEGKVKSECSEDDHAKNRRTEFIITRLK